MAQLATTPARVAVLRFGAVGDVVLTTSALAALAQAWPAAEILYVTKARFASLLAAQPWIGGVLALEDGEGIVGLRRRLVAWRPEVILDLHAKLRSRLLAASVLGRRVTWRKRELGVGLRVRLGLSTYRPTLQIVERYHQAVERLVGTALPRQPVSLAVSSAWREAALARLLASGFRAETPLVGLAPGAMWPTKQWPAEQFAALAQRCLTQGWQVVVTGSQAEAPLTAQVAAMAPGVLDLGGWGSLVELVGLVSCCQAFVANDSGPMHIARALCVPTLAIFGSTSPVQFDLTGHRLLYAGLDCSPCSLYGRRRCPRGHLDCLRQLDAERAWQSLVDLVTGPRPAPVCG